MKNESQLSHATKTFIPRELKFDGDEGKFSAVFATLNVIDKDGDITLTGAFGQQKVYISQFNHGSWYEGVSALPIGKGRIFERGDDVVVEGQFRLSSEDGKKTYEAVKWAFDEEMPQEWSYALPEIDYDYREVDGRRVRALKRIVVPEVSPVLLGSGVNTRLLDIKSGISFADHIENVLANVGELVGRTGEIKEMRDSQHKAISPHAQKRLRVLVRALKSASMDLDKLLAETPEEEQEVQKEYLRFLQITSG